MKLSGLKIVIEKERTIKVTFILPVCLIEIREPFSSQFFQFERRFAHGFIANAN